MSTRLLKKSTRIIWHLMVLLLALVAIFLTVARVYTASIDQHKLQLEQYVSRLIHHPVHFARVHATWHGIQPVFKFRDVTVFNEAKTHALAHIDKLDLGVDLIDSVLQRRIAPGEFLLSGMQVAMIQQQDGSMNLNGIQLLSGRRTNRDKIDEVLEWLLTPGNKKIQQVSVSWQDMHGRIIHFPDVAVDMKSGGRQHVLQANLSLKNGESLTHLVVKIAAKGNVLARHHTRGRLYVSSDTLDLAPLMLPDISGLALVRGKVAGELWLDWHGSQINRVQTQLSLQQVTLANPILKQQLSYPALKTELAWVRGRNGWKLLSDQFTLVHQQATQQSTLVWSELNLAALRKFLVATHLLDLKTEQQLTQMAPTGLLQHLTIHCRAKLSSLLSMSAKKRIHPSWLSVQGQLQQVSWSRWGQWPQVKNLSGTFAFDQHQGWLKTYGDNVTLALPTFFEKPLSFKQQHLDLKWKKTDKGWYLYLRDARLNLANTRLRSRMRLFLPAQGEPQIDMIAGMSMKTVTDLSSLLPTLKMPPRLVQWLGRSISNGELHEGVIALRGPLKQFPFTDQQGRFIATAQLDHVYLDYNQRWPAVSDLRGELIFDNRKMHVSSQHAVILDKPLQQVTADIQNLCQPYLQIHGQMHTNAQHGLFFLTHSPLRQTIGRELSPMKMRGQIDLTLDLGMRLGRQLPLKVNGTIDWRRGVLAMPQWGVALSHLQGQLQFDERGISAEHLSSRLYGQPLALSIATLYPEHSTYSVTKVGLASDVNLRQLKKQLNLPWLYGLTGKGHLEGELLLHRIDDKVKDTLLLTSDLLGIKSDLPPPLDKTNKLATASTIRLEFDPTGANMTLDVRNKIHATMTLAQAKVSSSASTIQTRPAAKVAFNAELKQLDWDRWQDLITQHLSAGEVSPDNLHLQMKVGKLLCWGQKIQDVELLLDMKDGARQFTMSSDKIKGVVSVGKDFPQQAMSADFSRLIIDKPQLKSKKALQPQDIPPMNVTVDDFIYNGVMLGHAKVSVTPENKVLHINHIQVDGKTLSLSATGEWQQLPNYHQTTLTGALRSPDLGLLLKQFDINDTMVGGKGKAHFTLAWFDSLLSPSTAKLNGKLKFHFDEGQIVKLSAKAQSRVGLGRVLNLFSLQSLPRRLKLDFSDLTKTGFVYDTMEGDIELRDGNAYTNAATIQGPVAKVAVNGRIGLAQKDYRLHLAITPYVTSSLPVVATIAGGPIVGAATWLVDKVISKAVTDVTTVNYKVVGPWSHPDVRHMPHT